VVGLYLNPPDKAPVLSVDKKSPIQALDRSQAGLPLKEGRCATMPDGLQEQWPHQAVRRTQPAGRSRRGQVLLASSSSAVLEVPAPAGPGVRKGQAFALHPGPLRHAQAPEPHSLAGRAPEALAAFHPDQLLLAEPGGALVSLAGRQTVPPGRVPQRRGAGSEHGIASPGQQRKPEAVRLGSLGGGDLGEGLPL